LGEISFTRLSSEETSRQTKIAIAGNMQLRELEMVGRSAAANDIKTIVLKTTLGTYEIELPTKYPS